MQDEIKTYDDYYQESKDFLYKYAAKMWSEVDLGERPAKKKDLIIAAARRIKELEKLKCKDK
jgi:hypothetical protein